MSYYWECFKRGFCSPISRWEAAIFIVGVLVFCLALVLL